MMKNTLLFFLILLTFSSCWNITAKKEGSETLSVLDSLDIQSTNAEGGEVEKKTVNLATAVILPTDGYRTYRDHYAYIDDQEPVNTDSKTVSHFDDTISVGLNDNDYRQGLSDSLKLGQKWLCINLEDDAAETAAYTLHIRKTVSHSFNDMIDYLPVTLLSESANDDQQMFYNIAFRGDYTKSDFGMSNKMELSDSEITKAYR